MRVVVRYHERPGRRSPFEEGRDHAVEVEMPEGSTRKDLCDLLRAEEAARYRWDGLGTGGRVVDRYSREGPLEAGAQYRINNFLDNQRAGLRRLTRFEPHIDPPLRASDR